jgi:hypothetical protein
VFVLGAFLVGYYLGSKSEDKDLSEVIDSIRTIATSDEVRDLAVGAFGMATDLLRSLAADGRAGEVVEKVAGRGLRAV